MNETAITAEHLSRDYGKHRALTDVNLKLKCGRVIALLGPNGAGKTTLLGLLTGQLKPTEGQACIFGHSSRSLPQEILERVVYMGDAEAPPAGYSAGQLFRLQSQIDGFDRKLADDFLAIQQLDPKKPFGDFSKGQKKWIRAAMVLAAESNVIFMDEPAEGLDPAGRIKLYEHLRWRVSQTDAVAVVATHIIADIEKIADEVIIINHGKVVVHEDIEDIREQVREVFVSAGQSLPDFALSTNTLGSKAVSGGTVFWIKAQGIDADTLPASVTVRPVNLEAFYLSVAEHNHGQQEKELNNEN